MPTRWCTYDAAHRKLSETDAFASSGGQTFGYDDAGRLTSWTAGAAATQSWNLTKVGDWASTTRDGVTETREHKPVHEAVQVGPNILIYDAQGNLTKDEKGTALAWDPENRLIRARVTRDASATGFGSVASYRFDALGRRIGKTVDGTTTFYLPSGAQTVVEIDRPALPPSQAAIDGAEADGALANLAEAPASGGILPGAAGTVTRINFQPATTATPAGFIRDTGKTAAVRTNGLTYGWSADVAAQAVVRGGAVPLVEFDTFIQAQTDAASASWSIALPNGTYPVVVVAGDALSTEQTNNLVIGGVAVTDATPSATPGYQAGNFDGYAVEVTVTDGVLSIAPGSGAYHAKFCFVEIGAAGTPGTLITPDITAALAARIAQANAETGANPIVRNGQREYIYGSYIDDVVAYVQTVGAVSQRYYPCTNHLFSVAALTDAAGDVVERYTYTAYGRQTKAVMPGKVGTAFGRGFTGYIADGETGLCYARSRIYSSALGRFLNRMPWSSNNTLLTSNYHLDVMPQRYFAYHWAVMQESLGTYVQGRMSLYDALMGDPANSLEPFSTNYNYWQGAGGSKDSWGHAALTFDDTNVSFFPRYGYTSEDRNWNWPVEGSLEDKDNTERLMGGKEQDSIEIPGLNKEAMKKEYDKIRDEVRDGTCKFRGVGSNCSSTVVRVILAGLPPAPTCGPCEYAMLRVPLPVVNTPDSILAWVKRVKEVGVANIWVCMPFNQVKTGP